MKSISFAILAATTLMMDAVADVIDPRVRTYVDPVRVVWQSPPSLYGARRAVKWADSLAGEKHGQVPEKTWGTPTGCRLENNGDVPGIILDFGRELHGGIQLGFEGSLRLRARIRFGESVSETMAELGERGAGNDHAIRDFEIEIPHMGEIEIGNTGFRFVRIDLVSSGVTTLEYARAVSLMRQMRRVGAFRCSDERLNRIWETAVDTVQLCCQTYVWDGIKRDRLVWIGDLHPEMSAVLAVFGAQDVVRDSIEMRSRLTPPDKWMNLSSYNMWWIRCVRDWYFYTGDVDFLRRNADYLRIVVGHLRKCTGEDGRCMADRPFLDWPSKHNELAVEAGMQALLAMAYRSAAEIESALGDKGREAILREDYARSASFRVDPHGSKQAAALLALERMRDPKEMFSQVLCKGGVHGMSTFYGYYMIEAMSNAGETRFAMDAVRDYWGAMLDMGATSFWENFDVAWTNGASRIDEIPVPGMKDIHGDFGEFCYPGFRHSLCHGWASGPAAWCIRWILGIRPVEPGCKTIEVKPNLGNLDWAEGALALPDGGAVHVRARKTKDAVSVKIDAPFHVKIVR